MANAWVTGPNTADLQEECEVALIGGGESAQFVFAPSLVRPGGKRRTSEEVWANPPPIMYERETPTEDWIGAFTGAITPILNADRFADPQAILGYHSAEQGFEKEKMEFYRLRESLLPTYRNKYVAISEDQVVDSDEEIWELTKRFRGQYGRKPVYMRWVGDREKRLIIRTPFRK